MRVLLVCAISRPRSGRKLSQGGGSSSTTQDETQHNSTGSLLNGQQLEHYKQMIKNIDTADRGSGSNRDDDEHSNDEEDR